MRSAASGRPPACTGCGCHAGPHADTWRVSPLPAEQQLDTPQKERLGAALAEMDQQLRKLADTPWLCQPMEPSDEEVCGYFRLDAPGSPFRACIQCIPRSFVGVGSGGGGGIGLAAPDVASEDLSVQTPQGVGRSGSWY